MIAREERIEYSDGDVELQGLLFRAQEEPGKQPLILIAPTAWGQSSFERDTAKELVASGYSALVLDLYGGGAHYDTQQGCQAAMAPLLQDRNMLRRRIRAGLTAGRACSGLDCDRIVAIGFCFGGLSVVELARSGAELAGVVGFHALLSQGEPAPEQQPIRTRLLILHGQRDPLVPPEQVMAFEEEMRAADADWQLLSFGLAGHSFSMPQAADREEGYRYHPLTCARAWRSCRDFLAEVLA